MMLTTKVLTAAGLLLSLTTVLGSGDHHYHRWAEAAYRWIQRDALRPLPHKAEVKLYFAKPSPLGRLVAISADGGTRQSGSHDSVLVIDTTPHLRLGHPLHLFFLDLNSSRPDCEAVGGVLLEGGDCLRQWTRGRCHRRLPARRGSGCAVLYPPEVRVSGGGEDLLRCWDAWAPCPPARRGPASPACDPLTTNSKGCDAGLSSPCLFMRTCHHALLLSGGWNKQLADQESFNNLRKINNMLKKNGFAESNIKIFFGNGLSQSEEVSQPNELGDVYPSSLKLALRYHLRSLCETKHCANTLFIYLNSPARPDGASLLWDISGNGEFDESEVYTVKELLRDIGHCKSERVVLVSDQSFSSELIRSLDRHPAAFRRTLVLSPAAEDGRRSLVDLLGVLSPWQCLSTLPVSWRGADLSNTTLSGSPCGDSLRAEPSSCQNLSTLQMLEPEQVIDTS